MEPSALSIAEMFRIERRADSPAEPDRGRVRAARFEIMVAEEVAGHIDLRLETTEHLRLYGGHIGYFVAEAWRGHGLAAWAVRQVLPVARAEGLTELWITCNPDNHASRRTAEKAGAVFVETIPLPPDNDMYLRGDREKSRFRLLL